MPDLGFMGRALQLGGMTTKTDSYKLNHWNQYLPGTTEVRSYFESRKGALYPFTVFFGLQPILLKDFVGQVVNHDQLDWADRLSNAHFGARRFFNSAGWAHILNKHGGRLPLSIWAVPEGTPVNINNVMMLVYNTDPECYWLTNYVESRLTHVWHPSTVATLSRAVKKDLKNWLDLTSDIGELHLPFMLHDFGYRGTEDDEPARQGGAGHLVNFLGTDTVPAMERAVNYYGASLEGLAYSVPATEHSVMTAGGRDGEEIILDRLLNEYPKGILSVVGDSYDIYNFVENIVPKFKDRILARQPTEGGQPAKFVVRPDSKTPEHPEPGPQMAWIVRNLAKTFGTQRNSKGYEALNPKVGGLWGDGIDHGGINQICQCVSDAHFALDCLVFGMGGGLLQKMSRDTQDVAFKCCAQTRDGVEYEIYKQPRDQAKISKRGNMKLVRRFGAHGYSYETVCGKDLETDDRPNELVEVFRDGEMKQEWTFDQVRKRAELHYSHI